MDTFPLEGRAGPVPDIPGFHPVRILGRGSQGSVWLLAPHDGTVPVAAKFLARPGDAVGTTCEDDRPGAGVARHNESQITQEWRFLAQFRHEHLVPVQRLARDADGAPVLLMDFAAGGSLSQVVRARGPLTVGEAVTVLTPMGQVLAFLHGRGAVHGDVSPGNILLTAAGKPMLADFGFGRLLGQEPGPPAGTLGFHCPTDREHDGAADVYSLASVGWFALTGRPAPPTQDRMPLVTMVPGVPPELVAALEAGLEENPSHRPTAAAFAQAVFRSARAEALALGHAVHPSVLPELPTRRDVRARGRGAVKRGRAGNRRRRPGARLRPPGPVLALARVRWRRFSRLPGLLLSGGRRRRLAGMWDKGEPREPRGTGPRPGLKTVALGALVAAVLVAVLAGGGWGLLQAGGGQRPPTGNHSAGPDDGVEDLRWARALPAVIQAGLAARDPVAALVALAWTRSYALSTADGALLGHVNATGSPAAAADREILGELVERGHTLTGLESSVTAASALPVITAAQGAGTAATDVETANVLATVATSPFAEQDAAGNLIHKEVAGQTQELVIVLVRVDGRWLVREVMSPAG